LNNPFLNVKPYKQQYNAGYTDGIVLDSLNGYHSLILCNWWTHFDLSTRCTTRLCSTHIDIVAFH